ncbi:MAG: YfcE family phosphodiesterase [Spirochaetaceae bacterium]
MKVAVLSDIHDNIWNLERALTDVNERGLEALLFLGDFCAPFTLKQIGDGFSGPVYAVFGNNDGDQYLLSRVADGFDHIALYAYLAEIEIGGRHVALCHYPEIAERLYESAAYDAVFSGHDHTPAVRQEGRTLWGNPGEVMGRFGKPSYGIYDTVSNTFDHIAVSPG